MQGMQGQSLICKLALECLGLISIGAVGESTIPRLCIRGDHKNPYGPL